MRERIEAISKQLSELGIKHQSELPQDYDHDLMQRAAYIEQLNHVAYDAIEAQYAQFNPQASKDEQIIFSQKILAIKNILRDLQVVHNDLTENLYASSALYIHDEQEIALNPQYILPELKEKEPKEIVRANFYQLLANISKNNSLNKKEFNYVNSLLMQLASRPEGIKLIVKLNYLLTTKDAQLILKPSNNFECSMAAGGLAKTSPEYARKSITSEQDFKAIFKRETVRGTGTARVNIGVDYHYNDKISALNLEVYASPGKGLTDIGPPFILLGHELIHALHNLTGKARHNFAPFFHGPKYTDDPLMQALYPTNSMYSYGPSAEEYWTIEGGTLCENSLRKEHGLSNRTGHISAEQGSKAIRDLYYLGLARSYSESDLENFASYITKVDTEEDLSQEDQIIGRVLQLEQFNYLTYSLANLMDLSKITSYTLKRMEKIVEQLKNPTDGSNDEDTLHDLLMNVPPKIAQLLIAVARSKELDSDEEIDTKTLNEILPNLQRINEMLKSLDVPKDFLIAFNEFAQNMETKSTKPHYSL
ncbi:M91 family zinc metallopeptidase [Legionella sp. WA2022007384]